MPGSDELPTNTIRIPGTAQPARKRRASARYRILALVLTQAAMAAALAALYLARRPSDLEPFRFFVHYGPRPLFALPLLILVPLTVWTRQRWLLGECLLALALVFGPLMDLHVNLPDRGQAAARFEKDQIFRFMTFNIGTSTKFQIDELVEYLKANEIDVLLVQEDAELVRFVTKMREIGWFGNRLNTVFSRWPILAESPELPHEAAGQYLYQAEVNYARIRRGNYEFLIGSAHAPSVRGRFYKYLGRFDQEELRKVMNWQIRQIERVALSMDRSGSLPIVLGGDFNTPPRSPVVRPLEKRFQDVFAAIGFGYGYTYPAENPWLRLDRFYVSRGWVPLQCRVARGFESDHLPLFMEVALESAATGRQSRNGPEPSTPVSFASNPVTAIHDALKSRRGP